MDQVLTLQQLQLRPSAPNHGTRIDTEGSLRVAAEMLSHTPSEEVTATTVVGMLGRDNAREVEALVADIAEEFGLESRLRTHAGSFSVRFSRAAHDGGPARL